MNPSTILLVDDDQVLSSVLRRVLTRLGYNVVEAGTVAQGLAAAQEHKPQLGLLDLSLPDGDGVELARQLRAQGMDFPLLLITAYPLRLREHPELGRSFTRVLTKPLNLQELRQAIDAALTDPALGVRSEAAPALDAAPPVAAAPARPPEPAAAPPVPATRGFRWPVLVGGTVAVLAVVAGLVFALPALGLPGLGDWIKGGPKTAPAYGGEDQPPSASPVKGDPDGLELPKEMADKIGVQTAEVTTPEDTVPLVLTGSLNLDSNFLARVHSRFPGEVVEVKEIEELIPETSQKQKRQLSFGDHVEKGQLLAVVWCKDLGEKKSELIDDLQQLWLDEDNLTKLEELARDGATSEATLRAARRTVAGDRNALAKVERTLSVWRVPKEETQEVRDEAKRVWDNKGKRDEEKEKDWAKVEVKAPYSGTLVEKNVTVGDIVDTTTDVFKLADLKKMVVWAHAYEDDLPDLLDLKRRRLKEPIPWRVRVAADKKIGQANEKKEATVKPREDREAGLVKSKWIDSIAPIIDPNQHTALVVGRAENEDETLRAGQFVTATIDLPAPEDVVAVPASSVIEDGADSVVFVQTAPNKHQYSLRHVLVVKRYENRLFVKSKLSEAEKKQNLQELHEGDRVVKQGALLLKATLEDVQAKAKGE